MTTLIHFNVTRGPASDSSDLGVSSRFVNLFFMLILFHLILHFHFLL